jgi:Protein of unknown function (DUF1579)
MKACMMLALATFLALVMGVAVLPAQEKKDDDDLSTPGPEHKLLEALAGTYTAKVKAWVEPGKDPEISDGAMKRKMLYGGRYLLEEFEGKLGPEPLSGMGFVGFDKSRKKFVLAWIDSMSTGFMTSEGTYDAAKKTFTYLSEDIDPTGKKMKGRDVLRIDSADQQTFEVYRQPLEEGAKEFKVLEIIYTRKK